MEHEARRAPQSRDLPTGVEYRGSKLWVRYSVHGKEHREPVPGDVTSVRAAARYRAEKITERARGLAAPDSRRVTVNDALDTVLGDYEDNGYSSERDAKQRADIIRSAIGKIRASDVSTQLMRELQARWQSEGRTAATVNRICNVLRRGLRLLTRETPPRLHFVPYIPRLREEKHRGLYITPSDADAIGKHSPEYVREPFRFALLMPNRRGQLSRTLRRYVDLHRALITWPPTECKADEPHTVPLDGEAFAIIERAMGDARTWCPYLFHGPRCAPGRTHSKRWGCLGDIRTAWAKACEAAGLPVGRKAGGFTFHMTRNTSATDLRAGGMAESDCMALGGWKTRAVFDWYNLGDVEALRERLAASRGRRGRVVPLKSQRSA